MAKSFPLKGENMRTSASLNKDLSARVPKFVGIPRYLIIGKDGKVLNWDTKRPSDGKALLDQLKSYL